jgi:hypothetical protein
MATKLPSIPIRSEIADENGVLTPIWVNWFQAVFARAGGGIAQSNTELAQAGSTTSVTVGSLQSQINIINGQVSALQSGLGVGRVL